MATDYFTMTVDGRRFDAPTIPILAQAFAAWRDTAGVGASDIGSRFPVYRDGAQVGELSYNGRFWPASPEGGVMTTDGHVRALLDGRIPVRVLAQALASGGLTLRQARRWSSRPPAMASDGRCSLRSCRERAGGRARHRGGTPCSGYHGRDGRVNPTRKGPREPRPCAGVFVCGRSAKTGMALDSSAGDSSRLHDRRRNIMVTHDQELLAQLAAQIAAGVIARTGGIGEAPKEPNVV
ncbi:MAG TPA: hypothetical protein VGG63_02355, partial [Steroidobacteraceae bacterium]